MLGVTPDFLGFRLYLFNFCCKFFNFNIRLFSAKKKV